MGSIRNIKKQNNQMINELKVKNEGLINDILCYVRADLNSIDAENSLSIILGDLKEQNDNGKDLKEYVGDYKSFLTSYTSKYKKKKGYTILSVVTDYLSISIYAISFCILVDMIFKILESGRKTFEGILSVNYILRIPLYLSAIIVFLIAMLCIKNIAKSSVASNSKVKIAISNTLAFLISLGVFGFFAYFLNKRGILNIYTFTVKKSFIAVLIILIVTLIANGVINFKQNKKDMAFKNLK